MLGRANARASTPLASLPLLRDNDERYAHVEVPKAFAERFDQALA